MDEFDDFIAQQQIDEYLSILKTYDEEMQLMAELEAAYAASLND